MKCRLYQTSLPKMRITFVGQQTVAQKDTGPFERTAFREIPLVRDQHITDRIRMIYEHKRLRSKPEPDDITEL